ncbi:MAG: hypothetical protein WD066_11115 [Planctomycetaceae bacterium]
MSGAVAFIQWENFVGSLDSTALFAQNPITFNSRQPRLHELAVGDRLWLVSRNPADQQYYFVALLSVEATSRNDPCSAKAREYGEYAIVAHRAASCDLATRFAAEGLLRSFQFEPDRPIKYGANIGQSLQTLRFLSAEDAIVLDEAFRRVTEEDAEPIGTVCGLWTKCDRVFADYFLRDWTARQAPMGFLLYDWPPALPAGSPIFIHSDKELRLVARFRESQHVSGHKFTASPEERIEERERIWRAWRAETIGPESKSEFDAFWDKQYGVRGLLVIDEVIALPRPSRFREYGRAVEWGYPTGVGYRYLSLAETYLLLRLAMLDAETTRIFLRSFCDCL